MELRKFILIVLIAVGMLLAALACQKQTVLEPSSVVVMGDLSGSSPLAYNEVFAARAGALVGDEIKSRLNIGDTVEMRVIGARRVDNVKTVLRLTPQERQDTIAGKVAGIIAASPKDQNARQDGTAILFALEQGNIKCRNTTLILISDGMEASSDFGNMTGVLREGVQFPSPPKGLLTGCRVKFLGIGVTKDDEYKLTSDETAALITSWKRWFSLAGVKLEDMEFITSL